MGFFHTLPKWPAWKALSVLPKVHKVSLVKGPALAIAVVGFRRAEWCKNRKVSGHKSTCPEIQSQNALGTSPAQPHLPNQHDQHSSGKQGPQKHPKAKPGA